jgi:hypothetical protein
MPAQQPPETVALFALVRAWLDHHYPGVSGPYLGGTVPGDSVPLHLPIPACRCNGEAHAPARFEPNEFQLDILGALEGRILTTDALAAAVKEDRRRLYKPGGLKELVEQGWVKNRPREGYYRPDAPPAELA